MMISVRHRFAFLAMTKAASTSIEAAIAPHCEIVVTGDPRLKHMSFRRYQRFFGKFLDSYDIAGVETFAVIRHPVDWLHSWYRYRGRPGVAAEKSTRGISFDAFVEAWLISDQPEIARVGRPMEFLRTKDGELGIDRLYRFEHVPTLLADLSQRVGETLPEPRKNTSPAGTLELDPKLRARLERRLARDIETYEQAI